MDYAALKAADAALDIDDLSAAAMALNNQSKMVEVDVQTSEARAIILPTGEYGALVLMSETRDFTTVPRELVIAAITAVATFNSDRNVKAGDAVAWAGVQRMLGAFVQAKALSTASRDAILALRTASRPAFSETITADDVLAARSLT